MVTLLSVVIDNFYAGRVATFPHKAQPPLAIDADTVLPLAVTLEGFQLVTRRQAQKIQGRSRVELLQFAHGHSLKIHKPCNATAPEKCFGIAALKVLNHA